MNLHTPGTLVGIDGNIFSDSFTTETPIAKVNKRKSPHVTLANSKRLVACWNACDGIDTSMLEGLSPRFLATYPDRVLAERRALETQIAVVPELLKTLIQAVESSGFSISGPTDKRAAENGEPAWVCNARAVIAKATAVTPA